MNKVWVYLISFWNTNDEYGDNDYLGTYIEIFPSKESAERFKKDFEEEKNLKYISGRYFNNIDLYNWYNINNYSSSIDCKEIMNY